MLNFFKILSCLICFLLLFFDVSVCLSSSSFDDFNFCLENHKIKNFTIFPYNDYYKILNFSIQNLRFAEPTTSKPIVIVLQESLKQLKKSLACCREFSLGIRVRSGGHSYEGTFVAVDSILFVIIDMMNLNHVKAGMETKTMWVEGGATLEETYYAISQASDVYGFSAGSCPTVGVGRHIGGGGFGLLSRKYGLAVDNVVDALLVDAEGWLLDRKTMGDDVFWTIRGGCGGVWGTVCMKNSVIECATNCN